MKKKIAIQTFKLRTNYGGILQAFSLEHYLITKGYDVIHLNRAFKPKGFILKLKIFGDKIVNYKAIAVKKKSENIFKDFIKRFISLSPTLYTTKSWENYILENRFEAVIVGSDQVWRKEYVGAFLDEFFLNFPKGEIKKIAYAASFGVDSIDTEFADRIGNRLHDFDALSVREKSGVDILHKHFNLESSHLIDPTLLLNSSDYVRLFDLKKESSNPFIFAYVLDKNSHKQDIISKVEKTLGVSSNLVYGTEVTKETYHDKDISSKITIEHWLQNFYNAEYVVTDSFHGMVFSIIFNKPFIVIANENRGASRFESMLDLIDLKDRLIFNNDSVKETLILKLIDFEHVNSIVEEERHKSNNFILNVLDDE